jgi:hypothetical protein
MLGFETYGLRMPIVDPQNVGLRDGDVLVLEATRKGLGRSLYVDDQLHRRAGRQRPLPQDRHDDWVVSAHQAETPGNGLTLEMLLAAEKDAGRFLTGRGVVRQVRPQFIWFELRPQPGNGPPVPMTWRNVDDVLGYPAPMWKFEAPGWPKKSLPVARAWVRELSPVGDPALSSPAFPPHQANDPLPDVKPQVRVAGEEVTDLSVEYEYLDVEEAPGVVAATQQPCMVVRLRHQPDSPVVAHLEGLGRGAWHRFYKDANKYTGVFWPVTKEDAQKTAFTLSLISVRAVQSTTRPHEVGIVGADSNLGEPSLTGPPTGPYFKRNERP